MTVPNRRDVGEAVNRLAGRDLLRTGRFFRSGALAPTDAAALPPGLRTIVNLRRTADPVLPGVASRQNAPSVSMDNYDVEKPVFREWLTRLFAFLGTGAPWPVLLHCTAGKDRTGIAVAAILLSLDLPPGIIRAEYELTTGRRGTEPIGAAIATLSRSDWFRSLPPPLPLRKAVNGTNGGPE